MTRETEDLEGSSSVGVGSGSFDFRTPQEKEKERLEAEARIAGSLPTTDPRYQAYMQKRTLVVFESIAKELAEMNRIGRWNFMLESAKSRLTEEDILAWTDQGIKERKK